MNDQKIPPAFEFSREDYLRIKALSMAIGYKLKSTSGTSVIELAAEFYKFIVTNSQPAKKL